MRQDLIFIILDFKHLKEENFILSYDYFVNNFIADEDRSNKEYMEELKSQLEETKKTKDFIAYSFTANKTCECRYIFDEQDYNDCVSGKYNNTEDQDEDWYWENILIESM